MKAFLQAIILSLATCAVLLVSFSLIAHYANADTPAQAALRANTIRMTGGTGFMVQNSKGERFILTNWHVCFFNYDSEWRVTHSYFTDAAIDLCAISQKDQAGPAIKLAPDVTNGQTIFTRGYPDGTLTESTGEVQHEIKWTYVFGLDRMSESECPYERHYSHRDYDGCWAHYTSNLTTLFGLPGSSGSPVVDSAGLLVGVISSAIVETPHATGMVRLKDIRSFLEGL